MPGLEFVCRSSTGPSVTGRDRDGETGALEHLRDSNPEGEKVKCPTGGGRVNAARSSWDKRAAPFPSPQSPCSHASGGCNPSIEELSLERGTPSLV